MISIQILLEFVTSQYTKSAPYFTAKSLMGKVPTRTIGAKMVLFSYNSEFFTIFRQLLDPDNKCLIKWTNYLIILDKEMN